MTPEIFNGGESPLASKGAAETALSLVQTGASQSDGGPAPSPSQPSSETGAATSGGEIGEPPQGGVVRARKG
jgi:hypothetical protein